MAKVALVSLGCPKNLVDSEGALGEIAEAGHELVIDKSDADVIIVNTCGFIESSRAESVEAILEAVEEKQKGRVKAVVVIGCLSQRYKGELMEAEAGIDAALGIGHAGMLAETLESVLAGRKVADNCGPPGEWMEHAFRIRSTPPWTAYLKISDGCDNRCAYCAIPEIRGPFRSRPERLILDEAKRLADEGVKELILVGQDLTHYGADLDDGVILNAVKNLGPGAEILRVAQNDETARSLPELLVRLAEIDGPRWIRLLYCYPTKITRELIEVVARTEKIVKYLDIPLQHGDDRVLRAMGRRGSVSDYLRVIDELREACPEIALRSSFIVGFPSETSAAFGNLLAFVERIQFDRVGVFAYSREEGTPAWDAKPQVSVKTAASRLDRLMRLQQRISLERNRQFVGKTIEVLVEEHPAPRPELVEGRPSTSSGRGVLVGRSYRDAPEIDGVVYIKRGKAALGEFVQVTITEADEYDLRGEVRSHRSKVERG